MRRNSSLEKHGRVLTYLATNGPTTKYQIEKDLRNRNKSIDHATLHKICCELKKTFLITVVKEERSRAGLRVEYYDLTPLGLLAAIEYDTTAGQPAVYDEYVGRMRDTRRKNWTLDMDELAKKYPSHLPLIFGKWQFFKKSGWKPERWLRISTTDRIEPWYEWVLRLLKVPELGQIYQTYLQDKRRLSKWIEPNLELYKNFFLIHASDRVWSRREKLVRIWASDPDIVNWMLSEVTSEENEYLARAREVEKRRKQLEAIRLRVQQREDSKTKSR